MTQSYDPSRVTVAAAAWDSESSESLGVTDITVTRTESLASHESQCPPAAESRARIRVTEGPGAGGPAA